MMGSNQGKTLNVLPDESFLSVNLTAFLLGEDFLDSCVLRVARLASRETRGTAEGTGTLSTN